MLPRFGFSRFAVAFLAVALAAQETPRRWTAADVDATLDLHEGNPAAAELLLAQLAQQGVRVLSIPYSDPQKLAELYALTQQRFHAAAEDLRLVRYLKWPAGTDVSAAMEQLAQRPEVEDLVRFVAPVCAGDIAPNTAPVLNGVGIGQQGYAWQSRNWPSAYRTATAPTMPGGHGLQALDRFATPAPNGALGRTTRIGVLEMGFDTAPTGNPLPQVAPYHEDLQNAMITVVFEGGSAVTATQYEAEHGMATLGILVGDKDLDSTFGGPGVTGMCAASPITLVQVQSNTAAGSILVALGFSMTPNPAPLATGDVLLIELQLPNAGGALPVSTDPGDRAAIQSALALGVHVIEPAGNGARSVDGYPDSGSIMVGAINPTTGAPSAYNPGGTNFGLRVNVCSWGSNCATLGAINNPGGIVPAQGPIVTPSLPPAEQYTTAYSGTSSASAVIAGLVAAVLDARRASFHGTGGAADSSEPLPDMVRNALREAYASGLPSPHIGTFPDAMTLLRRLAPAPYGKAVSTVSAAWPAEMTNRIATGSALPLSPDGFSEPRIGSKFLACMRRVPIFPGYYGGIALSLGPQALPAPLGVLYVDPTTLLYFTPQPVLATFAPGCTTSAMQCGQLVTPLSIPPMQTLVGAAFYLQGFVADYTNTPTLTHVTNGLKVVLMN